MNRRLIGGGVVKEIISEAKAKASLKYGAMSLFMDPNLGDLTMARVKLG
jgi:hypothetical protein